MATQLAKDVCRKTSAMIFDSGKRRAILVTLTPPCYVKVRLEGTKRSYSLDAATIYELAVRGELKR